MMQAIQLTTEVDGEGGGSPYGGGLGAAGPEVNFLSSHVTELDEDIIDRGLQTWSKLKISM